MSIRAQGTRRGFAAISATGADGLPVPASSCTPAAARSAAPSSPSQAEAALPEARTASRTYTATSQSASTRGAGPPTTLACRPLVSVSTVPPVVSLVTCSGWFMGTVQ